MRERSNHFSFYFICVVIIAIIFVPIQCSTEDPSICYSVASMFMEGFLQVEFLTGSSGYVSVTVLAIIIWYFMYTSLRREKPLPFIVVLLLGLLAYFVVPLFI